MRLGLTLGIDAPQTRLARQFAVANAFSATSGLVELPNWLTIACATTGRTTQTSASTFVRSLGANAARGRNVGSGAGLSVECARTNLACGDSDTFLGAGTTKDWGNAFDVTIASVAAPDGTSDGREFTISGEFPTNYFLYKTDFSSFGVAGAHSIWSRGVSRTNALKPYGYMGVDSGSTDLLRVPVNSPTWSRLSGYVAATDSTFIYGAYDEHFGSGYEQGIGAAIAFYACQFEAAKYPSSYIPIANGAQDQARAGDVLTASPSVVAPGGYFDIDLTFAPNYSQAEFAADHNLFYFDANNRLYLKQSDQTMILRLAGANVASGAFTFAREDAIRVRATHRKNGKRLQVAKNGAVVYDSGGLSAAAAISPPASVGVLGDATTTTECADLRALTIYRP